MNVQSQPDRSYDLAEISDKTTPRTQIWQRAPRHRTVAPRAADSHSARAGQERLRARPLRAGCLAIVALFARFAAHAFPSELSFLIESDSCYALAFKRTSSAS